MGSKNENKEDKGKKSKRIMKEGKKLYVGNLGIQLTMLDNMLREVEDQPEIEKIRHIYRIIHTIKGSAPIFGFVKLGKLAKRFIHIWEWVQSEHQDVRYDEKDLPFDFAEKLEASRRFIAELRLEHEICLLEIEYNTNEGEELESITSIYQSHLLLVDDDDVLRSYLSRRFISDGYKVDEASNIQMAKKKLYEKKYDLVTLDLMMYPESGYEIFDFMKADPALKWTPLIVISGSSDIKDKIRCFKLGADDYVTKPFQYEELGARIFSLISRTHNFEQMAFRDPLTGVNNRRYFDYQIQMELKRIERYPESMCLVFIDIDHFKSVNDEHGHHIGDLTLQGLSHIIQQNLRSTDLLARFGGEEFVIALPNTTSQQAFQLINKILDFVRHNEVVKHEGRGYSITFSAGIAEFMPGLQLDEWIRLADEAMYQAKEQGRNRVLISGEQAVLEPDLSGIILINDATKLILIADDDPILRSMIKTKLHHLPVNIIEAEDGDDAALNLKLQPFDLCILDGLMPKRDGFSLLKQIKSGNLSVNPNVKVLMLSGQKREDAFKHGLLQGADDYISKPFSIFELEFRVKQLLGI